MRAKQQRANKVQTSARINDLIQVMLDGATPEWDIEEYVREREAEAGSPWFVGPDDQPLSYSQVRRYSQQAERELAKASRTDRAKLFARHLAQRRGLFQKAVAQGDVRAALAVLDSEARLLDLFPDADESKKPASLTVNVNLEAIVGQAQQELKEWDRERQSAGKLLEGSRTLEIGNSQVS